MINIGGASFHSTLSHVDEDALKRYAIDLFGSWEALLAENLKLSDYYIKLEVTEGSTLATAVAYVWAAVLIVDQGATTYMNVRSVIHAVREDMGVASTDFTKLAANGGNAEVLSKRRMSGVPGKIDKLYGRVARGELTATEASVIAAHQLSDTPEEFERLQGTFLRDFSQVKLHPEQLTLLPEEEDEEEEIAGGAPTHPPGGKTSRNGNPPPRKPHYSITIKKASSDHAMEVNVTCE